MVVGVWREVVERLTPVPLAERQRFLDLPPTREAHEAAHASVTAFHQIELRTGESPILAGAIRIAAWNLERCLYPQEAARILQRNRVDLALLTEMDVGVLRTGQAHTIGRIAAQLGQGYCYGCEFLELLPMEPPPGFPHNGSDNTEGYHGNGIVASLPLQAPIVIRLDEEADWYTPPDRQRRIGNRMAIAAEPSDASSPVQCIWRTAPTVPAAHGRCRRCSMRSMRTPGGLPVVIGGDLNTHVGPGGHSDASEPLFALAASRGYDWRAGNLAQPTTRTSTWSTSEGTHQLDWFCTRGLSVRDPAVVPALAEDGSVLSDHELILLTVDTS